MSGLKTDKSYTFQANTSYVIWVAAYNTSFIAAYLTFDTYFFPPSPERELSRAASNRSFRPADESKSSPEMVISVTQPPKAAMLLEAINVNGLPLFLLVCVIRANALMISQHISVCAGERYHWPGEPYD